MVRLILVRHGESEYNVLKKFSGQLDVPLTELGRKQAEITAKYILQTKKIDVIYSSDLSRAVDTVKPVADALGLPIHTEKGLREICLGDWTGMQIEDVREKHSEAYQAYQNGARAVNGESRGDVLKRAMKAVMEIAQREEGKTVLVGSHNGTIRLILQDLLKQSGRTTEQLPVLPNNSLSEIVFDGESFFVERIGEVAYLEALKTTQDKDLL